MKERIFIQKAREQVQLEEFVRNEFATAKCSDIEVQHTPIGTRIIIYTATPGLVIGSGGEKIKETVEKIKKHFNIENPQIDVQRIENPDLDPNIHAQNIAASIEKGVNCKKVGHFHISKIMEAGAAGCEIRIVGKLSGERARHERFSAGYLKKCGHPAETDVIKGFARANPKLGMIGITVKIMVKPQVRVIDTLRNKFESAKETPKEEMSKEEKVDTHGDTKEKEAA